MWKPKKFDYDHMLMFKELDVWRWLHGHDHNHPYVHNVQEDIDGQIWVT